MRRRLGRGLPLGNSLQGMAWRTASWQCVPMSTLATSTAFPDDLRRWRQSRRVSQLELAMRAGTTQRHVSFIESGRSMPGRGMVVRLAESLELSLRDRNALLVAAGYAPLFAGSRLDAPALRSAMGVLRRVLDGHLPCPAVIVQPYGELVAANGAFGLLTAGASRALLDPPINVLRLALHPEGMAPRVGNLAEWGRHIINSLRAHALKSPDPRLDAFLGELESYVPNASPGPDHLGFAVPLRLQSDEGELRLLTTLTSFATAVDVTLAELRLEAFLPADDATAESLRRLYSA